jgi:glycerophosphoryl diester phosphodiesterase
MSGDLPLEAATDDAGAKVNRFRALFRTPQDRPLLLAHRGDSFHAPENTLEAARAGWESGADGWELDVHLSRDGVPVVLHDESLQRTTDVSERFPDDPRGKAGFLVSDFDLEEIRALDAGSWFLDPSGMPRTASGFGTLASLSDASLALFRSGRVRIPTLVEALKLTAELNWLVNVELKTFPNTEPRLVDAVLEVVEATGTEHRILISSFDHGDVALVAARRPEIATGVLASTPLHRPEQYVRTLVGADAYHPSTLVLGAGSDAYRRAPSPRTLRAGELDTLGQAGVPTLVYTVSDADPNGLASHLWQAGAFGLFSDNPAGLVGLFRTGRDRRERGIRVNKQRPRSGE